MDLSHNPFLEALNALRKRAVVPTSLTTAELQQIDAAIRRGSFYSAQTMETDLLELYKNQQEQILIGKLDPATARLQSKQLQQSYGYQPNPDERGTIKDLSSNARIDLVVKTNTQLSQGAGHYVQSNGDADVVDLWPAQELVRFEARAKERNWHQRWMEAAAYSGDTDAARMLAENGRMVARKDSPIWDALGSSELFDDGLDNPFPPFAFNSGMWVEDVSRDEAIELGLINEGDRVSPQKLDIASLFNFGNS